MRVWDWVISRWFGDRRSAVLFSRSWRAGVVLVLLCLTVYLPGLFTIPPIDRDESRFAQASRQMFEAAALPEVKKDPAMHSGGWVVPMLQDKPRLNKPPLVYWLQVASAWVFTGGDPLKDEIWMYRIPGVLCAILTVLMTWRMGLGMFDPRAAFLGAALLAVCPLIVFDAHQARADQLLLTTVVGVQWALWGVWRRARDRAIGIGQSAMGRSGVSGAAVVRGGAGWGWPLMFWVCIGASVLAKGPIGPMIAALTCLALCLASRRWRWMLALRPAVGIVIVAAIVGPWLYAVGEHVGWAKYLAIVKDETIGRSLEPKEGHWGPPGYHTVLLAVLFWPGSLTTAMAVGRAFGRGWPRNDQRNGQQGRDREGVADLGNVPGEKARTASLRARLRSAFTRCPGRDEELFCLAWIVPAWIVFELIGTKLPHYTMPMYPAVALISARCVLAVTAAKFRMSVLDRVGAVAWTAIGAFIALVTLYGLMTLSGGHLRLRPPIALWGAAWFALVGTSMGFAVQSWRGAWLRSTWIAIAHIVIAFAYLLGLVFPLQTDDLWLSNKIVSWIGHVDESRLRPVAAVSYQEDSLVFELRGDVQRMPEAQLNAWLEANPTGLVVLSDDAMNRFPALQTAGFSRPRLVGAYNYARGRREAVLVAERSP